MIIFLSALAFGQETDDGTADAMAVVTYGEPEEVAALIERQHAALQEAAANQATLEAEIRRLNATRADTTAAALELEKAKLEKAEAEKRLAEFQAQVAIDEAARLRKENEATAAARVDAEKAAAKRADSEARVVAEEARLKAAGVPDMVSVATAATLLAPTTRGPTGPATVAGPVASGSPCLGFGWIVGSLDDQNAYTPSGPVSCYSDKDPMGLKFRNLSENFGYVVVVNGMLVVPQIHGQTVVLPASDIPPEFKGIPMPAGITGLPMIPPGSTMYGSTPSLKGTFRAYRFVRSRITGGYILDEACRQVEYDRSGYKVDWEEPLGDGIGYCD